MRRLTEFLSQQGEMKSADSKPVVFLAKPELPTYASEPAALPNWRDGSMVRC